jgi:pre-60S factor REI1
MQFVSSPTQPQSQLFTCLTCQIAFPTAEGQRDHYRTDWHRYNLKRKVVDLPPIDFQNFQDKIQEQKVEEEEASADKSNFCAPCKYVNSYYSLQILLIIL